MLCGSRLHRESTHTESTTSNKLNEVPTGKRRTECTDEGPCHELRQQATDLRGKQLVSLVRLLPVEAMAAEGVANRAAVVADGDRTRTELAPVVALASGVSEELDVLEAAERVDTAMAAAHAALQGNGGGAILAGSSSQLSVASSMFKDVSTEVPCSGCPT